MHKKDLFIIHDLLSLITFVCVREREKLRESYFVSNVFILV